MVRSLDGAAIRSEGDRILQTLDPDQIQTILAVHLPQLGLTYLLAFGLFLVLASIRVRREPFADAGWTRQHENGRLEMQKALGAQVQSTAVANVPEGPDAERVMRDLAAQGTQLIFATSFGYLEPALRVAADFPQVKFEHAGGYKTAANLNTYNARYYEARWLAGWLAGKASASGVGRKVCTWSRRKPLRFSQSASSSMSSSVVPGCAAMK